MQVLFGGARIIFFNSCKMTINKAIAIEKQGGSKASKRVILFVCVIKYCVHGSCNEKIKKRMKQGRK